MELFIGIVIGALAGVVATQAVKYYRWYKSLPPEQQQEFVAALRDERKERKDQDAREVHYKQRYNQALSAKTVEECEALKQEIEGESDTLTKERFEELVELLDSKIKSYREDNARRERALPRLDTFRTYRTDCPNGDFTMLHEILITTPEDAIVTYDEIDEFGTAEERKWALETYDVLLVKHVRSLSAEAVAGSEQAYETLLQLWDELNDNYFDEKSRSWEEILETDLRQEWNEAIVRFENPLDKDETKLIGIDWLKEEECTVIATKAIHDHDLLSMAIVLHLLEDDDEDMMKGVGSVVFDDLQPLIEAHYATQVPPS